MNSFNVVITHHGFPNIEQEQRVIEAAGGIVTEAHGESAEEMIAATREADTVLVQHRNSKEFVLTAWGNWNSDAK